jgi:hypothetical protein
MTAFRAQRPSPVAASTDPNSPWRWSASASLDARSGRTFAVPGRCWKAGVLLNPAVHAPHGLGWITRILPQKASDSVDYAFPTIPPEATLPLSCLPLSSHASSPAAPPAVGHSRMSGDQHHAFAKGQFVVWKAGLTRAHRYRRDIWLPHGPAVSGFLRAWPCARYATRLRIFRMVAASHLPPRAVAMPRPLRAAAI